MFRSEESFEQQVQNLLQVESTTLLDLCHHRTMPLRAAIQTQKEHYAIFLLCLLPLNNVKGTSANQN
jgi:hypothetical protein